MISSIRFVFLSAVLLLAPVAFGGKPRSECGNGVCEAGEDCRKCRQDCCNEATPASESQLYVYSECNSASIDVNKVGIVCRSDADCGRVCQGGTEAGKLCRVDDDCAPNKGKQDNRGACFVAADTCQPAGKPPDAFSFLAMGDVPYSDYEACHVEQEVAALDPADGHKFLVHLGDIKDGQNTAQLCDEAFFLGISNLFQGSPFPTFFIPGDNGFIECTNGFAEVYPLWDEYLFPYSERPFAVNTSWPGGDLDGAMVDRGDVAEADAGLSQTRPELFAFYLDSSKTLVVGTNTPGNPNGNDPTVPDEYTTQAGRAILNEDNVRWTTYAFDKYKPSAVIVLGHAISDSGGTNSEYTTGLLQLAADYPSVPFLVLLDSHCFVGPEIPYTSAPNVFGLRQDDASTPITVSVNLDAYDPSNVGAVFGYDRGCWCHTDHRPTKDIFWDSGQCFTKCNAFQNTCDTFDKGPDRFPNWCNGLSCPEGATCSY